MAQRSNKELWEHFERVLNQTGQVPKPRTQAVRGQDLPTKKIWKRKTQDPDFFPGDEPTPPGIFLF